MVGKRKKSDTSEEKSKSNIQHYPQYRLSRIIIVFAFVLIAGMLIIHYITTYYVITSNPGNATAVGNILDRLDRSNQTLFNILLPIFAAWVGVVVDFYFGSEQARRAQETLVEALSPEAKLSTIKVEDALNRFPDTRNIHKVTLDNTLKEVIDSFGNFSDVLVVDKEDKPLGILYKADLFSKTELKDKDITQVHDKKLKDIIEQITPELITEKKWDVKGIRNFASVRPDDNLLHARERMYGISNKISEVRCVVVDATGKAIGIFSYDVIAALMK
jgi:CBS domain-containing protein